MIEENFEKKYSDPANRAGGRNSDLISLTLECEEG
jgi:hypothetical protein